MQTSEEARKLFGKRLAALRDRAGLVQQELADGLTMRGFPYTYNAISGWERGAAWPPLLDSNFANALAETLKTDTKTMFALLGFFAPNGEIYSPFEVEVIQALRKRDQQKIIEVAAKMGAADEDI